MKLPLLLLLLAVSSLLSHHRVYYCTHQLELCVEHNAPVALSDDELPEVVDAVLSRTDNFIGFVDANGVTLQFNVEEGGVVHVDITAPNEEGPYSAHLTTADFISLVKTLHPPYLAYRETLGMKTSQTSH